MAKAAGDEQFPSGRAASQALSIGSPVQLPVSLQVAAEPARKVWPAGEADVPPGVPPPFWLVGSAARRSGLGGEGLVGGGGGGVAKVTGISMRLLSRLSSASWASASISIARV